MFTLNRLAEDLGDVGFKSTIFRMRSAKAAQDCLAHVASTIVLKHGTAPCYVRHEGRTRPLQHFACLIRGHVLDFPAEVLAHGGLEIGNLTLIDVGKAHKHTANELAGETVVEERDVPPVIDGVEEGCLLYTSPSPRDLSTSRMPSSA